MAKLKINSLKTIFIIGISLTTFSLNIFSQEPAKEFESDLQNIEKQVDLSDKSTDQSKENKAFSSSEGIIEDEAAIEEPKIKKNLEIPNNEEIIEDEAAIEEPKIKKNLEIPNNEEIIEDEAVVEETEIVNLKNSSDETLDNNKKDRNFLTIFGYVFFFLTILSLLIVTLLLLKEIRWRKRYKNSQSIVFPDAHLDFLEALKKSYERLYGSIIDFGKESIIGQKNNESLSSEMITSLAKLNSIIDSQKSEIERLKQGYDFTIKKNSILPLIELYELVSNFLNESNVSGETNEKLSKIDAYLKSYLEELDVEEFNFKNGEFTRDLSADEFEIEGTKATDDENFDNKIVRTTKNGYMHNHLNGKNVLIKAKVLVYKLEKKDG